MQAGPDISRIGTLIGDPTRAAMLLALMDGRALTASELAQSASITPSTASTHIRQLTEGGLVTVIKQGRHRYVALKSPEVAETLEAVLGLAQSIGHTRFQTGPKDPALRQARVCYDHIAGSLGVSIYQALVQGKALRMDTDGVHMSPTGIEMMTGLGIDCQPVLTARRPSCRNCLDWSERTPHLAGGFGAALLVQLLDLGWVRRDTDSRALNLTRKGELVLPKTLQAFKLGQVFRP